MDGMVGSVLFFMCLLVLVLGFSLIACWHKIDVLRNERDSAVHVGRAARWLAGYNYVHMCAVQDWAIERLGLEYRMCRQAAQHHLQRTTPYAQTIWVPNAPLELKEAAHFYNDHVMVSGPVEIKVQPGSPIDPHHYEVQCLRSAVEAYRAGDYDVANQVMHGLRVDIMV